MITVKNITKTYQTDKNTFFTLSIENLSFPDKGLVVLTGQSGCGKTTLLDILSGLNKPDSGEVLINNEDIDSNPDFYDKILHYTRVDENIIFSLTVKDNLSLVCSDTKKIEDMISFMNLPKRRKGSKLSKGETERLAIGIALLKNTPILLIDEPTANLDESFADAIFSKLKEHSKSHLVIIASHDIEMVEKYADTVVEMKEGKIIDVSSNPEASTQNFSLATSSSSTSSSKKNLFILGAKKTLSNKGAFITSLILTFMSFLSVFVGFNYKTIDREESSKSLLNSYEYYNTSNTSGWQMESLPDGSEYDNPFLWYYSTSNGPLFFDDNEALPEVTLGDPILKRENTYYAVALTRAYLGSIGNDYQVGDTLPTSLMLYGNLHCFYLSDIIEEKDYISFSSSSFGIMRRQDFDTVQNSVVSLDLTQGYQSFAEAYNGSIGSDERQMSTSESIDRVTTISTLKDYNIYYSIDEAVADSIQSGKAGLYINGRLPVSDDEIVLSSASFEDVFNTTSYNTYLRENNLEYATISYSSDEYEGFVDVPSQFKVVGTITVIYYDSVRIRTYTESLVTENLFNQLLEHSNPPIYRASSALSAEYLKDNIDLVLDGTIRIDGMDIHRTFDSATSQSNMFTVFGIIFMVISVVISFIYQITILKSLSKEETLLTIWGFKKKRRMSIYIPNIILLLVPPFLLALILSPFLFSLIANGFARLIIPDIALIFTNSIGYIAILVLLICMVAIYLIPPLLIRGKKER